jgi:hypothetical protein
MTRNCSVELTRGMRTQFEALRGAQQLEMAARVLRIVGVREVRGRPYITTADMHAHEPELMAVLGDVRAWFTAKERQRLYKNNEHLGVSVAKLVLETAGHPLERSPCAGGGGKFSLASGALNTH